MKCPRCFETMYKDLWISPNSSIYNCVNPKCAIAQLEDYTVGSGFFYTMNLPGKYNDITIETGKDKFGDPYTSIYRLDDDFNVHVICNLSELMILITEERLKMILTWS